jgi:hypothetical protein
MLLIIFLKLSEKYNFPPELSNLFFKYKTYKNSGLNCDGSRFSFPELEWIYNSSKRFPNFVDVVLRYEGMGHYLVVSWDKNRKVFFIRGDGGSNGYERADNEKRYESLEFYEGIDTTKTFGLDMFQNIIEHKQSWENLYQS